MKDLKQSCKALGCNQQGKAAVAVLATVAVVAAGIGGFVAGKKNVNGSMGELSPQIQGETKKVDPVVARVDGSEIKRQEVLELINAMPVQMRRAPVGQLYPLALEQAVNNKLIDRKAVLADLERDNDVQKQLWKVKKQLIRAKFLKNEVTARISDEKLKEAYDKYVEEFPEVEEVKASHILVDDEMVAKDVIKKLNKGADFAELAKENSKDASADKGGDVGYFAKDEVVAEFSDAAFSADQGTYVKKPVKSEFGYHVIKVEDKRMRAPAAYERVSSFLRQELERKELQDLVEEWKKDADVERFDITGAPFKVAPEDETVVDDAPEILDILEVPLEE